MLAWRGVACRGVGRAFLGPVGLSVSVGRVVRALSEGGADGLPGGGDHRRPAPGRVDTQPDLPGSAGDAGRDVQDPVAERGDLHAGEFGLGGESDQTGPGDEIGGGQDDLLPGGIGREGVAWQVTQAGALEFADAVLDAGVLTVP